jgi:putative selenium metabolism protein SsnA
MNTDPAPRSASPDPATPPKAVTGPAEHPVVTGPAARAAVTGPAARSAIAGPAPVAAVGAPRKDGAAGDLALCGGIVVTSLDPVRLVTADVVISGGRIASVGTAPAGVARRDCSGTLVLPGNVCAHHHLYSALSRGMPYRLVPPQNFLQILQRVWWRLDRALDEASVRLSALVGGLDALRSGTTTVIDHHASPNFIDGSLDVIAAALAELGLRSLLCYEVTDRDGPARAAAGVAENRRFLTAPRPLARGMMGAHASFTLSNDTLAACAEGAAAAGVGVHIHVAEDAADQADAEAAYGMSVIERLDRAGILRADALLAHCVHVTGPEIASIAASGAAVAHNARSNMNNRVGYSPLARDGARVALGTDGIGGDMITESQAAYFRAVEAGAATDPGWPLRRLAEGARIAGRGFGEPGLGTIVPGAPADLTVLDYQAPAPLTAENLPGHWVFGNSPAYVRDVVVAGDLVIADARSTRVDEAKIAEQAAREAKRLWARLEEVPPHPFAPKGR